MEGLSRTRRIYATALCKRLTLGEHPQRGTPVIEFEQRPVGNRKTLSLRTLLTFGPLSGTNQARTLQLVPCSSTS